MSFIINEQWLHNRLTHHKDDTIVIDANFQLGEGEAGKKSYLKSHIPTAIYLDLDKDLSGAPQKHGGQHPLPDINTFANKLGSIGVDHHKTVVIYDQGNGMFASRAWWLFHYVGHEKVYVLDGGVNAWKEAGYALTDEIIQHSETDFKPNVLENAVVHMDRVKEVKNDSSVTLIDSRSRSRYLGQEEKLYDKAGHIPGAKNFFWKDVLNEDGTWKEVEQIKANFSSLSKEDEIIVSCGSGVSACPNVIGLKMAGYENIKLYPGSFSDWISYEENELETEEE